MIKVLAIYKSVRHERKFPHNLVSIFQVENVSPLKKHSISPTTSNRFSSHFHQNDHSVLGHLMLVTDDLANLDQGQNLQKVNF